MATIANNSMEASRTLRELVAPVDKAFARANDLPLDILLLTTARFVGAVGDDEAAEVVLTKAVPPVNPVLGLHGQCGEIISTDKQQNARTSFSKIVLRDAR